ERYLRGRGPATAKDLSWWSGLTVADATRGIELAEAPPVDEVDGRTRYAFPPLEVRTARRDPAVHLLPDYDELFIGFADRRDSIDPTLVGHELPPGVLDAHVVTVDGRAVGGWRRTVTAREVRVDVRLVIQLDRSERAGLTAAALRHLPRPDADPRRSTGGDRRQRLLTRAPARSHARRPRSGAGRHSPLAAVRLTPRFRTSAAPT
ncbi:MAG: hypothetical protein GEU73_09655, partial [Chloroflexi bacterium]|nr:hypothetical protein [Chloroflexota bacterium]